MIDRLLRSKQLDYGSMAPDSTVLCKMYEERGHPWPVPPRGDPGWGLLMEPSGNE